MDESSTASLTEVSISEPAVGSSAGVNQFFGLGIGQEDVATHQNQQDASESLGSDDFEQAFLSSATPFFRPYKSDRPTEHDYKSIGYPIPTSDHSSTSVQHRNPLVNAESNIPPIVSPPSHEDPYDLFCDINSTDQHIPELTVMDIVNGGYNSQMRVDHLFRSYGPTESLSEDMVPFYMSMSNVWDQWDTMDEQQRAQFRAEE
jgi:hypothetical protein